jgi:hypothetical protein
MKKVIVLLALVVVGAIVFAEAPTPDYSFSATVTAKWQYDFMNAKSGFTNESDVALHFDLLNGAKKSKAGESGTYGQIDVSNLYLGIFDLDEGNIYSDGGVTWGPAKDGDGDNLSISAKIVSGNFWVGLGKGAYQADYNNASYVPFFDGDDGWDEASAFNPAVKPAGSIQIGYKLGDLGQVAAVFGSNLAGAVNTTDNYDFGVDVTFKPVKDILTLVGGFWLDGYNKGFEGYGWIATGKASVAVGIFSAYVAIDAANGKYLSETSASGGVNATYDQATNVTLKLFEGKDSIALDTYYTKAVDIETTTSSNSVLYHNHQGDIGVKFVDAEGLVPGLGFTVFAGLDDLLNDANSETLMSFAGSVNYKIALSDATYVKPSVAVRKDMAGAALLYYKGDVEAVLFPNTTFNVTLEGRTEGNDNNHRLVASDNWPMLTVAAKVSL